MTGLRRQTIVAVSAIFVAGVHVSHSFAFVPKANVGSTASYGSSNGRRLASQQRAPAGGALIMKGSKGNNGPGLTNVGRMVETRERMKMFKEPQKVMVSNLDFSLNEDDIRKLCSQSGRVARVKLIRKRNAKTSKGYAFVDYQIPLWATAAIEDLNGAIIKGRRIEVKSAFSETERQQKATHKQWLEEQGRLEEERRSAEDTRVRGDDSADVSVQSTEPEEASPSDELKVDDPAVGTESDEDKGTAEVAEPVTMEAGAAV